MVMTREERLRRQPLDDGDPDDIVWIKQQHAGTQRTTRYHSSDCDHVDCPDVDIPDDEDALHYLRDNHDFDGAEWLPKTRAFERRGSKTPGRCVLENDHGAIPCTDCPQKFATIDEAVDHYHHAHTSGGAVAADGGDD